MCIRDSSKPPKPKRDDSDYQKEFNVAYNFQKSSKWEDAIEHYNNAIKIKADYPEALSNRGHCYKMLAKDYLKLSGQSYAQAIKLEPNFEEAIEYQGVYFLMEGRIKDAYQNLQKLIDLNSPEAKYLQKPFDKIMIEAKSVLEKYNP